MVVRNWELVGGNPAPGDPTAYDELAKAFGDVADNAESVHGRLERLKNGCDSSIWQGEAADAFREDIGKLPADLKKLMDSYRAASGAMSGYAGSLRTLQGAADRLVEAAELTDAQRQAQQEAADAALATDPAASTATYDDAIEIARQNLRLATQRIDDIRERRRAAETKAIDGLGHAGDIGIHNVSGWKKFFRAVADAAEIIAFVVAVVAIVIVIVVALGVPGLNFLTLGMAAFLFNVAQWASIIGFVAKATLWAYGDEEISGAIVLRDGLLLGASLGAGALTKDLGISVSAIRASFTRTTTTVEQIGTVYRLTRVGSGIVSEASPIFQTSVRVVHVSIGARFAQAVPIDTLVDTGFGLTSDIPVFLWDHAVGDAISKALTNPLPVIVGPDASRGCTAVHARIAP